MVAPLWDDPDASWDDPEWTWDGLLHDPFTLIVSARVEDPWTVVVLPDSWAAEVRIE